MTLLRHPKLIAVLSVGLIVLIGGGLFFIQENNQNIFTNSERERLSTAKNLLTRLQQELNQVDLISIGLEDATPRINRIHQDLRNLGQVATPTSSTTDISHSLQEFYAGIESTTDKFETTNKYISDVNIFKTKYDSAISNSETALNTPELLTNRASYLRSFVAEQKTYPTIEFTATMLANEDIETISVSFANSIKATEELANLYADLAAAVSSEQTELISELQQQVGAKIQEVSSYLRDANGVLQRVDRELLEFMQTQTQNHLESISLIKSTYPSLS